MTLNIENLNRVLDYLEAEPVEGQPGFQMANFVGLAADPYNINGFGDEDHANEDEANWCGTTCCIAGLACQLVYPTETYLSLVRSLHHHDPIATVDPENVRGTDFCILNFDTIGARVLGLDAEQSHWLFYGHFARGTLLDITREQAAAAIRALIENPEIHNQGYLA